LKIRKRKSVIVLKKIEVKSYAEIKEEKGWKRKEEHKAAVISDKRWVLTVKPVGSVGSSLIHSAASDWLRPFVCS
jgi:hypothetical protein